MSISYGFQEVLILAPIVGLLLVGVAIALQSGLEAEGTQHARRCLASNFSQLLLRLAGYGVALLAMQRFIGIRMDFTGKTGKPFGSTNREPRGHRVPARMRPRSQTPRAEGCQRIL